MKQMSKITITTCNKVGENRKDFMINILRSIFYKTSYMNCIYSVATQTRLNEVIN